MKKVLLAALIASMVICGLISCKNESAKDDAMSIGIAMPETHVARWVTDGEALKANAEAMGYKADVAFGDGDQIKQNKQISDFITKGVDLIVVASINTGVNTVLAEAEAEGIDIISYDRLLMDSADFNYYITFNLKKVGELQGKSIVEALDFDNSSGVKYITLFAGSPTDNNAYFFYDGAMEVLNPYVDAGKLEVVGPYPRTSADKENFNRIATKGWRAELAKERMEKLLSGDAEPYVLDAVLAPNDPIGRVVAEACSKDAKYDTTAKLPIITGQDGELATVQYIRDGKQHMTVFKDSRLLAAATIELADDILKGNAPSVAGTVKTEFDTNMKMVETYLLTPILVTIDNYKKVIIGSGYYTADQLK